MKKTMRRNYFADAWGMLSAGTLLLSSYTFMKDRAEGAYLLGVALVFAVFKVASRINE